jgi:hypothetical protein
MSAAAVTTMSREWSRITLSGAKRAMTASKSRLSQSSNNATAAAAVLVISALPMANEPFERGRHSLLDPLCLAPDATSAANGEARPGHRVNRLSVDFGQQSVSLAEIEIAEPPPPGPWPCVSPEVGSCRLEGCRGEPGR